MHTQDQSKGSAIAPPVASNPIHVVGSISAKELAAARLEALRPFHLGLAEADRNMRALLPKRRPNGPDRPSTGFKVTDESPAFNDALAGAVGPIDPLPVPSFELWAPWYVDAADQPA